MYLVVLLVEKGLNTFFGSSNSLSFVLNHSARRISLVNARSPFVNPSDQQCNTVRSRHGFLLWWRISFSEVKSKIGDGLSKSLDGDWFKISETVVKSFDASMFDESSSVGDNTTGRAANVRVDFEDFFDWLRNDKSRLKSSFDCENDSFWTLDADSWGAELHDMGVTLMASMAY